MAFMAYFRNNMEFKPKSCIIALMIRRAKKLEKKTRNKRRKCNKMCESKIDKQRIGEIKIKVSLNNVKEKKRRNNLGKNMLANQKKKMKFKKTKNTKRIAREKESKNK